jgi:hypothetical protein
MWLNKMVWVTSLPEFNPEMVYLFAANSLMEAL